MLEMESKAPRLTKMLSSGQGDLLSGTAVSTSPCDLSGTGAQLKPGMFASSSLARGID